jgi:acyl-CoA synthetase (NDP forming)
LDLTAQGLVDPELYRRTLPPVLDDDAFGSVMLGIILTDPATTRLKLPPIVDALSTLKPRTPVIFAALDEGAPFDFPELEQLRALGVPCFPSPERALRAIGRIAARTIDTDQRHCEPATTAAIPAVSTGVLTEFESKKLLAQLGIPVPAGNMAQTADDALRIASEIGYPIALKAQSRHLPHKSDSGGVQLGIDSDHALLAAWEKLHGNVRSANPALSLDGVLVERMGGRGAELIIGARNDAQWGPVLLIGFGGVLAEAAGDVRLLAPDLSAHEIECELHKLHCSALLRGYRGAPAVDVSAAASIIANLGRWMRSEPRLLEIDINPVVVYAQGKGALALDALISIAPERDPGIGKDGYAQ